MQVRFGELPEFPTTQLSPRFTRSPTFTLAIPLQMSRKKRTARRRTRARHDDAIVSSVHLHARALSRPGMFSGIPSLIAENRRIRDSERLSP